MSLQYTRCQINRCFQSIEFLTLTCLCWCLFTIGSCSNSVDSPTKTRPNTTDLVGTWVPDQTSLKYMRDVGGYNVTGKVVLVLDVAGTYEMTNMPDWFWLDDGLSHKSLRSEKGTWEVSEAGDNRSWIVLLRSETKSRGLEILGQSHPYKLRFSFGNIDTNPQTMTFVRELH